MTGKEIAAKLREALALMNNNGAHWIKGASALPIRWGRTDDPKEYAKFCSIGAIRYLTSGDPWGGNTDSYEVASALAAQIEPRVDGYGRPSDALDTIVLWNDAGTRRWEDIVEAFEKAAAKSEQGS